MSEVDDPATELIQDARSDDLTDTEQDLQRMVVDLKSRVDELEDTVARLARHIDDDQHSAATGSLPRIEQLARQPPEDIESLPNNKRRAVQLWSELPNHADCRSDHGLDMACYVLTNTVVRRAIANIESRPKGQTNRNTARRVLHDRDGDKQGWFVELAGSDLCRVRRPEDQVDVTDRSRQRMDTRVLVPREEWVVARPERVVRTVLGR